MLSVLLLSALSASLTSAQITYTGCHYHTTSGIETEYCFGPNGIETARGTYTLNATNTAPASASAATTSSEAAQTTAVTDCHSLETAIHCINGAGSEVLVEATPTGEIPAAYTGCHSHGEEMFCVDPEGSDVAVFAEGEGDHDHPASATADQVQTTAVTACHSHETEVFCIDGAGSEVHVEATPTGEIPAAYTGCHSHGGETYCLDPEGAEVVVHSEEATSSGEGEGANCHEHAGVLHCVGGASAEVDCGMRDREYDIGLRVGTIFVILVTSAIGVFAPLLLKKLPLGVVGANVLMAVKQFGTGVIISTAFVHLYTHADLMFQNECIGTLQYEATTSAIVMAGLFLSFLVEYVGLRFVAARSSDDREDGAIGRVPVSEAKGTSDGGSDGSRNAFTAVDHHHGGPNTKLSVMVMEAGILFHSVLIGLTLVVSGNSFYRTLLIVIVFHQFFEGLALGARIAMLPGSLFPSKFLMAGAFTLITPIGMAIGLGVLNSFNGNNPSTVIAFGTLDALSAGILLWVGVVDMWARDWVIEGGEMMASGLWKTLAAGISLLAGIILMSVLGRWA